MGWWNGAMAGNADAGKEAMRREMRARRAAVGVPERLAAAAAIEEAVLALPAVREAGTVLVFYSFGSEVPTSGLVERLLAGGHRVLLPFLDAGNMEAAEVLPGETLVHTSYGPKEPARRVAVDPAEVDVVIAPGLAFDRAGHRLGYGGGHYDRYLTRLEPGSVRVGVGFAVQLADAVPAGHLDQRVDVVVTEDGAVECRPPRDPGPGPPG